jgi:hypothetical protein
MKDLNQNTVNILTGDSYTVGMDAEAGGMSLNVEYAVAKSGKQLSGNVDISNYGLSDFDFLAGLTSSEVKLQIPDLDDHVFVYNYKKDKDGYITTLFDDETIAAIDQTCEALYSQKDQKNLAKKIGKAVLKEYHSLKFKKVDKEEFEVNDKDRKCKGYQTTVTADNLINVCDSVQEILEKEYKDTLEDADIDLDDIFDEITDELDDEMEDVDLTFYIYRNKLACIQIEVEDEKVQILFKGGDDGMQNIDVKYFDEYTTKGETVMKLKGTVKGTTEKYSLAIGGADAGSLEYDYKSGDLVLSLGRYFGNISIDGNLQSSSKSVSLTIDDGILDGMNVSGTVYINKKASMQKFKGKEFDVGNAEEDDFEDLDSDLAQFFWYFW